MGVTVTIAKVLLLLLLLSVIESNSDLIQMSPRSNDGDEATGFFLSAKSSATVARAGETVDLTCQTSQNWHLCSWRIPTGDWCDRLSTAKYATACHNHERVRFQRAFLSPTQQSTVDPGRDCSVTVVDLEVQDGGKWQCLVKEEVRSSESFTEYVELTVAVPYSLSLDPAEDPLILIRNSNSSLDEVVCVARGDGGVDPEMKWQIDGEDATEDSTRTWREVHTDGYKIIYLALTLENNDSIQDWTKLRCLSKQYYPNGTIIYESSITATVTIVEEVQELVTASSEMKQTGGTIAGGVITGLIVAAVLIALGLLCFAQKYKKWCYATTDPSKYRIAVSVENEDPEGGGSGGGSDPIIRSNGRRRSSSESDRERTSLIIAAEPLTLNIPNQGASETDQDQQQEERQEQQEQEHKVEDEEESPPPPPPSAPPIEDANVFFRPPVPSSISSTDDNRLMELITAPPPPLPVTRRSNSHNVFSSTSPSVAAVTFPTFGSRNNNLSESLTTPRNSQVRRSNEYVRVKPNLSMSEENPYANDASSSNSSSDTEEEERSVVAAAANVHNQMNSDDEEAQMRQAPPPPQSSGLLRESFFAPPPSPPRSESARNSLVMSPAPQSERPQQQVKQEEESTPSPTRKRTSLEAATPIPMRNSSSPSMGGFSETAL